MNKALFTCNTSKITLLKSSLQNIVLTWIKIYFPIISLRKKVQISLFVYVFKYTDTLNLHQK